MGLDVYRKKRDFRRTPEPAGERASTESGRLFVVQKHAARQLHYDFRLEHDGVLLSWAVPKGPSLDPADKRLAVHVEDHPIEYADFEGIIPEGEYGGGTVLVWDIGRWDPVEDVAQGLKRGSLKFRLAGQKLAGGWALVRLARGSRRHGGDDDRDNWLLIKEKDDAAAATRQRDVVEDEPRSVLTGRTIDEVAKARDRVWHSNRPEAAAETGSSSRRRPSRARAAAAPPRLDPSTIAGARAAELPPWIEPELATLVDRPPEGDDWLHEIKLDGYRAQCRIENGRTALLTRRGNDWSARFAPIAAEAATLPVTTAVLDGEVVVLAESGRTDFQALQNALNTDETERLAYFVFDLLHLDGYDLRRVPLVGRKGALAALLAARPAASRIRYMDHVAGHGEAVFREACALNLEGIVCKRATAAYRSGRGRDWLKVKCLERQEFVIGGFTDPEGARTGIGALLLGVYDAGDALRYVGRVGTGFTRQTLAELYRRLASLEIATPPFANAPRGARARGTHWVRPELVAEVQFTGWTEEPALRHPSFQGLREDKAAVEVVRETPGPASKGPTPASTAPAPPPAAPAKAAAPRPRGRASDVTVAGVHLTNPDRLLYPDRGITKRDLALFYESIADRILPHLAARPLTLVRCPEGATATCFFQKHDNATVPREIGRIELREDEEMATYLRVDTVPGLVATVQMGVLELHTWGSRAPRLEQPDTIVFDLDPAPDVEWGDVVTAARRLRFVLEGLGLAAFAKTTGGKGLHVVVPLKPHAGWDEVKSFTKAIAEAFVRDSPQRYVATMSKARRGGKVFIDYLRNGRGATAIAPFSTRARPGATVATPLAWDELGARATSDRWTVENLPRRLARLAADSWEGYEEARRPLTKAMRRAVGLGD